ncbi:MAG: hypothetical protein Q9191_006931 [Dirinaria sp. TL-2023a]
MPEDRGRLRLRAAWWRFLAKIGAYIHDFPAPKPAIPQFIHQITTTTASDSGPGTIELKFYVRDDYRQRMEGKRFPVIVNFHGGGFTLGTATDDGRWASAILEEVQAVFVSVEYRLAPEHAFPIAIEDGVEALLYLASNSEMFGIDNTRMVLSGFSAGGNMTFTVPLKLQTYLNSSGTEASSQDLPDLAPDNVPKIVAIVSWYPIVDYGIPRAEKRAASLRPEKCMPAFFTDLFDEAYLPNEKDKDSPFVSPANASDEMLIEALPDTVAFYLCEWDMLLDEGRKFAERLEKLGKTVSLTVIKEVQHGFDKMPSISVDARVRLHYLSACAFINEALGNASMSISSDEHL